MWEQLLLHNPERLFSLDEKIDRQLPRVRSLPNQRGQIWRLVEMYCFIIKEIIFEQYTVMNGEPV